MADANRERQETLELSRPGKGGTPQGGGHCNGDMKRSQSQRMMVCFPWTSNGVKAKAR
jgi:hypothetical protein